MTRADNTRYLAQAAAARHQAALARASAAVERLDQSGRPVTFSAVAATAGLSRAWLYRNPDIRELITRLRSQPRRTASIPAAQRATTESLRARLDAAREEITRLRAENAALREQAARHHGQQRASPHAPSPTPARRADTATRTEPHIGDM